MLGEVSDWLLYRHFVELLRSKDDIAHPHKKTLLIVGLPIEPPQHREFPFASHRVPIQTPDEPPRDEADNKLHQPDSDRLAIGVDSVVVGYYLKHVDILDGQAVELDVCVLVLVALVGLALEGGNDQGDRVHVGFQGEQVQQLLAGQGGGDRVVRVVGDFVSLQGAHLGQLGRLGLVLLVGA